MYEPNSNIDEFVPEIGEDKSLDETKRQCTHMIKFLLLELAVPFRMRRM